MLLSLFRILHSSHSIHISTPPTFHASSHSARNLLSCQTSSPACKYLRRRTLEEEFCGWADSARDMIDSVISERALLAFLEVMGMVDNEWDNRESHVGTNEGSAFSCESRDFDFS